MHPRGDEPFQVLERINDNAYKLDLPSNYGNVSATFNIADLFLFDVGNSRTNPFKEGGNDRDHNANQRNYKYFQDPLQGVSSPITRARIKRIKEALQGLIMEMHDNKVVLQDSKVISEVYKTTPRIITYLYVQDEGQGLELEEQTLEFVI